MIYNERRIYSGNTDAIKAAQNFFNEFGYTDGHGEVLAVDGDYGKNTYNAVIKYQRDNGLTVDGKIGDETWNHMWDNFEKKYSESEQKSYAEREYNLSGMAVPKNEPKKRNKIMMWVLWLRFYTIISMHILALKVKL